MERGDPTSGRGLQDPDRAEASRAVERSLERPIHAGSDDGGHGRTKRAAPGAPAPRARIGTSAASSRAWIGPTGDQPFASSRSSRRSLSSSAASGRGREMSRVTARVPDEPRARVLGR